MNLAIQCAQSWVLLKFIEIRSSKNPLDAFNWTSSSKSTRMVSATFRPEAIKTKQVNHIRRTCWCTRSLSNGSFSLTLCSLAEVPAHWLMCYVSFHLSGNQDYIHDLIIQKILLDLNSNRLWLKHCWVWSGNTHNFGEYSLRMFGVWRLVSTSECIHMIYVCTQMYSAFRKYAYPLTYSTFCCYSLNFLKRKYRNI